MTRDHALTLLLLTLSCVIDSSSATANPSDKHPAAPLAVHGSGTAKEPQVQAASLYAAAAQETKSYFAKRRVGWLLRGKRTGKVSK